MSLRRSLAVVAVAAWTILGADAACSRSHPGAELPSIAVADLPKEARATLERIRDKQTFPYDRDGVVFGNREGILPGRPRGYYHEYTVKTPGAHNRGARRIVCGGEKGTVTDCYYSDDHYQSFKSILP
jgi:ribonuclease T1